MSSHLMYTFLSEGSVKEHLSFLRTQRARLSIIEKSIPDLKGKSYSEIVKLPLKRALREDVIALLSVIKAHEIYFSSFTDKIRPSETLRRYYYSEDNFLYRMKREAMELSSGLAYVYKDGGGVPRIRVTREPDERLLREEPELLVDLYEHAYFTDYGFDKSRYLAAALSHLDLSRL